LKYIYRLHAIERMFQRDISEKDVEEVVEMGRLSKSILMINPIHLV